MSIFKFKRFDLQQKDGIQKVGTDTMVLGALAESNYPDSILDVGTGSGVLGLMMAQKFPKSDIHALDISKKAIELAQQNITLSEFPNQFTTIESDFLQYKPADKFDLIVTNPPFFRTQMPSCDEERTLQRHEGSMTIQNLINHAATLLSDNGTLWIILPTRRTEELLKQELALGLTQQFKIFGKPNRPIRDILVFSNKKKDSDLVLNELTIRSEDGSYSDAYKELTKDFHFSTL